MKDLGTLHYFLGVKVVQESLTGVSWIGQPSYTEKILQQYKMHDCKAVSTPVNPDLKLIAAEDSNDVCNQQMHQAVVGSLLYLATKSRPDIAYAVSSVARFCAKPHSTALGGSQKDPALPKRHQELWPELHEGR